MDDIKKNSNDKLNNKKNKRCFFSVIGIVVGVIISIALFFLNYFDYKNININELEEKVFLQKKNEVKNAEFFYFGSKYVEIKTCIVDENKNESYFKTVVDEKKFLENFEISLESYEKTSEYFKFKNNNEGEEKYFHKSYNYCFEKAIELYKEKYPQEKNAFFTIKQFSPNIFEKISNGFWKVLNFLLVFFTCFYLLNYFKSSVIFYNEKNSNSEKITFNDIAGYDEEKKEIKIIIEYLKNRSKFTNFNARLPKGVLLFGPPGTGKTLFAKAIAGEAKANFYAISGSSLVELFAGLAAKRIRDIFNEARKNKPSLIFFDEIDSFGRKRSNFSVQHSENEQALNQLLTEMDGFPDNSGVLVIGATNRVDVLDGALTRSGRFDLHINIPLPTKKDRLSIFKIHSRGKKINADVNFEALAKRTPGFCGADISSVMNEAALLAVRYKSEDISIKHIDEAIDKKIAGLVKKNIFISSKTKETIAYHEVGHAIVALSLSNLSNVKVRKITILPHAQLGGYTMITPDEDKYLFTREELLSDIAVDLGGRVSEEFFCKTITNGASNDIEKATCIAKSMVTDYGMSSLGIIRLRKSNFFDDNGYSEQTNFEIDCEVKKIIKEAYQIALKIIQEREKDVKLIVDNLLEFETLTEEQIDFLLKNRKLPEEKKDTALSSNNTKNN